MKSSPFSSSQRVATWVCGSVAIAWLAVGCGNNGGVGDGVYDDSMPPGGSTGSAGATNGRAGASSSSAGASGLNGSAGRGGSAGSSGSNGAAGASAGLGGSSGGGAGAAVGGAGASSVAGSSSGGASGGGVGVAGGGASPAGGAGPLTCGNGTVDTGETCDSGTLDGSTSGGTGGGGGTNSGGTSGGGIAGGGEDPGRAGAPSIPATYGQLCSNTCYKVGTQACLDCENAGDCFESVNNCLGVAAPFTAAQQSSCYTVMRCIQESNCFDGTGTLGKCYCGDLSIQACGSAPFSGAGSPNGACIAQIKAGLPNATSNSAVLGSLVATDFPAGAAMKRLSCQKGANTSACLDACGFTGGGPAFP